jgi:hypothetical protein
MRHLTSRNRGITMVSSDTSAPNVGGMEGGCVPKRTPPTDPPTMILMTTPWRGRRCGKIQLVLVWTEIMTIVHETRDLMMQMHLFSHASMVVVGLLPLCLGAHHMKSRGTIVVRRPHRGPTRPHTDTQGSLTHLGTVLSKTTVGVGAACAPQQGPTEARRTVGTLPFPVTALRSSMGKCPLWTIHAFVGEPPRD